MLRALPVSSLVAVSVLVACALVCCSGGEDGAGAAAQTDDAAVVVDGGGGSGSEGGGPGGDNDAANDGPRPPRCDPNKPFGDAVMVLENSFANDGTPRLSRDELTLYYTSYGSVTPTGAPHLWVATRTSTSVPFKDPKRIDELAANGELSPNVTADGLTMYFEGSRGDAGYEVLKATRSSTSSKWSVEGALSGLTLGYLYVLPDGSRLYGMKSDAIYAVPLPFTGAAPEKVLGGLPRVYWPVVSADDLTIYFAWPTYPYQWEIQVATRAVANGPFGSDKGVVELNTKADEHPEWISPDGCTIYFERVNGPVIPGNAAALLSATRGL